MAVRDRDGLTIRETKLISRNFSGEKKKYNAEGDRNFSVMVGERDAAEMEKQGWNVKPLRRREEDDEQLYHLKVNVNFRYRPPRIYLITSSGKTLLGESLVGMLDHAEALKVDVSVVAYDWRLEGGASGRSAYLRSMFFTMFEDELELEYSEVPQIGGAAGEGLPTGQPLLELDPGTARRDFDFEGEVEDDEQ